ncbi:unnamed protein product [Vitrella brassicaformis CCMP3155]|uniref:Uncharacterized protein n=1 Tax=Vitrella brassicaformis (strain CCMP3155) TaxID=1169540 RepID=A0A0G4G7M7_VITBC|nr:unnamed protein product [Vitrella brassicaformis CCMP3155]|eukprot:CEM24646.1 unnamed protein product [Vitrella brassicaformis CCMP3155]
MVIDMERTHGVVPDTRASLSVGPSYPSDLLALRNTTAQLLPQVTGMQTSGVSVSRTQTREPPRSLDEVALASHMDSGPTRAEKKDEKASAEVVTEMVKAVGPSLSTALAPLNETIQAVQKELVQRRGSADTRRPTGGRVSALADVDYGVVEESGGYPTYPADETIDQDVFHSVFAVLSSTLPADQAAKVAVETAR